MKELKPNACNNVQTIARETPKAESVYVQQVIYLMGLIYAFLFVHPIATLTQPAILAFAIRITKCLMEYATRAAKELLMIHHPGVAWLSLKGKPERQAQW